MTAPNFQVHEVTSFQQSLINMGILLGYLIVLHTLYVPLLSM